MAQEDNVQIQDVAAAHVQGDGTVLKQRGCTVERLAQGQYSVLVDPNNIGGPNLPAEESCSKIQVVTNGIELTAVLNHGSDQQKLVEIKDAADANQDADFSFTLSRLL